MLLAVGQFVECKTSSLGVGKLLAIDHGTATVGYFESPAKSDPIEVSLPLDTLVNTHLEEQVRVYFQDPTTLRWQVGRVLHYQESDREYLVQFPNDQRRLLPESLLTTRWSKPIADPTDHLALQLNETPFFHQGRSAFIHNLYSQRNACGGMPGLLSSAIDIVEHQISVVRRVLQDPFQRYLLADEVGLGKTIEAGILIRQYVLDEYESHRVLVIVPEALIKQWMGELCNRFHLEEQLGKSIHVVAHRDHGAISRLGSDAGMVVIDEAHHVAACAHSSDAESLEIFRAIASITSPTERRVLLLSATPVLHNETAFLAMLHLIDPLLYELGDTDAFRQRVRLRQSIAELVVSLTEAESNFFISQTLAELSAFFHGDTRFHSIRDSLVSLIANDISEDDAERSDLIRALRTHISETWRIHRRLLRNRRAESTDFLLPGRAGGEMCVWESTDVTILDELLAEWRLSVAQQCQDRTSVPDGKSDDCTLVRVIAEAAACDAHVLADLINVRLTGEGSDFNRLLLLDDELVALRNTPFFEGERDLLQQLRHLALRFDDEHRLQALKFLVAQLDRSNRDVVPAIVVFTNYPHTADRVWVYLCKVLGATRVLRHQTDSSSWTRFLGSASGLVLVCDRKAEEGLNLQNRGSLAIHFDLPFSANRIEQRIGRLDRFGNGRRIPSYSLVASDSPIQIEWFRCLNEALGVFSRSIASLQYVIDSEFQQVWSDFPHAGVDAIADATSRLSGKDGTIETEFCRVRAQDALDAFERDPVEETEFVDGLEKFDLNTSQFRQSLDEWLVNRLHFRASGEEGRRDNVVSYQFCRRDDLRPKRGEKDTLMSYTEFLRRFKSALDRGNAVQRPVVAETKAVTFDRQTARRRETRLARIGDSLVDAVEQYIRWDDRGICFAMWRYRPALRLSEDAELAFRFDLIAEANLDPLRELLRCWPEASLSALRRRADMAFPPIVGQMWLDSALERISDSERLSALREPYRDERVRGQSNNGQDFNLNQERWKKANQIYDTTVWRGLCFAAREKAEVLLREQSKMPQLIQDRLDKASTNAALRIEQFESRLVRTAGEGAMSLHRELEFEHAFSDALQSAIRHPSIRCDSIGALFLSRHNPFADERPAEDDD